MKVGWVEESTAAIPDVLTKSKKTGWLPNKCPDENRTRAKLAIPRLPDRAGLKIAYKPDETFFMSNYSIKPAGSSVDC
jgi:hypothetical protein